MAFLYRLLLKLFASKHIGGLIGLFTGMSVLSLFEIVFWFLRLAVRGLSTMLSKSESATGEDQREIEEDIPENQEEELHDVILVEEDEMEDGARNNSTGRLGFTTK